MGAIFNQALINHVIGQRDVCLINSKETSMWGHPNAESKCRFKGCSIQSCFGQPGGSPQKCVSHKIKGDVDVVVGQYRRCSVHERVSRPYFGIRVIKPKYIIYMNRGETWMYYPLPVKASRVLSILITKDQMPVRPDYATGVTLFESSFFFAC